SALAFKIMNDKFVGQLVFVRVYSGTLNAGSGVYNSTRDRKERVRRLVRMHADARAQGPPATAVPSACPRARTPRPPAFPPRPATAGSGSAASCACTPTTART